MLNTLLGFLVARPSFYLTVFFAEVVLLIVLRIIKPQSYYNGVLLFSSIFSLIMATSELIWKIEPFLMAVKILRVLQITTTIMIAIAAFTHCFVKIESFTIVGWIIKHIGIPCAVFFSYKCLIVAMTYAIRIPAVIILGSAVIAAMAGQVIVVIINIYIFSRLGRGIPQLDFIVLDTDPAQASLDIVKEAVKISEKQTNRPKLIFLGDYSPFVPLLISDAGFTEGKNILFCSYDRLKGVIEANGGGRNVLVITDCLHYPFLKRKVWQTNPGWMITVGRIRVWRIIAGMLTRVFIKEDINVSIKEMLSSMILCAVPVAVGIMELLYYIRKYFP